MVRRRIIGAIISAVNISATARRTFITGSFRRRFPNDIIDGI